MTWPPGISWKTLANQPVCVPSRGGLYLGMLLSIREMPNPTDKVCLDLDSWIWIIYWFVWEEATLGTDFRNYLLNNWRVVYFRSSDFWTGFLKMLFLERKCHSLDVHQMWLNNEHYNNVDGWTTQYLLTINKMYKTSVCNFTLNNCLIKGLQSIS